MAGPTDWRRRVALSLVIAVAVVVGTSVHPSDTRDHATESNEIFDHPGDADVCAVFEGLSLTTTILDAEPAARSDVLAEQSIPLTVAFLRRSAARTHTPPALRSKVRSLAGALERALRTGDFRLARQLATDMDRVVLDACT